MSSLTIPNTFTNNVSTVDAVTTNANNSAIVAAVNAIDRTNMGTAGIDATSLIPTTNAAATFGGVTAGVGYKFLASATTSVPLTISGVTSQSVDIFDVTLTSGGTKAFFVNSIGAVGTSGIASGAAFGDFTIARSATAGEALFGSGTTAQTGSIFFSANVFQIFPQNSAGGNLKLDASANLTVGNVNSVPSASTGLYVFGSSTTSAQLFFDGTNYNFYNVGSTASKANIVANTGVYTPTSDARLKENVVLIPHGLADVLQLHPVTFDWIDSKLPGVGFIAQEIQKIIPDLVSVVDKESGMLGINYSGLTPVLARAIQELAARVVTIEAAIAAHP